MLTADLHDVAALSRQRHGFPKLNSLPRKNEAASKTKDCAAMAAKQAVITYLDPAP